ncbi:uncharacterized protein EDB93DRAFT_1255668 [Suillus bovinus]|uniref:uncharacterized protein n=1 Tax=Suillus bovinus TaxID=48563 RepID=UPI001B8832BC|nr:uncharacterized protein EDB93DRAFT_1255668 [Suillus bovinus]KAG2130925.1 hypothetical protein EDB93DRAFT_1255668 [Suillus bovinus]
MQVWDFEFLLAFSSRLHVPDLSAGFVLAFGCLVMVLSITGPTTPSPCNAQHRLITSSMVKRKWRPQQSSNFHLPTAPPLLVLPGRKHLTQQSPNIAGRSQQQQPLGDASSAEQHDTASAGDLLEEGSSFYNSLHCISDADLLPPCCSNNCQKKINQWWHWTNKVIPSLITPQMSLLPFSVGPLVDGGLSRLLAYFSIILRYYELIAALVRLLPFSSWLALLELVKTLFVHITPNMTAWCETLKVFLAGRGYQLTTKDNLCRQLGNAYHWYSVLPLSVSSNEGLTRPSDFLRSRCPICFGPYDWQKSGTLNLRPPARGRKRKRPTEEEENGYENGMQVLTSALDGCGASFSAADEKCEKASTQFFADTGMMAMLCRHDHVLWLTNITSAGEKQHYALALIKKIFDNIPPKMTYRLLDDAILRWITFAISVFHAYSHQWACQIIYHPHKCEGFGLSDGEGCERLWSALKHLIALLRVSGFHQRLFILDTQVQHLDDKNLVLFGSWLSQRWNNCTKKKSNAMQALCELSVDETAVHQQWKLQVEHQTRPLPRRLKTSNDEEISKILSLEKSLVELDGSLRCMEMQLCAGNIDNLVNYNLRLIEECAHQSRLVDTLSCWKTRLGINAQALKTCIREQL